MFSRREETIIRSDPDGFDVRRGKELLLAIRWNAVTSVVALKRDAYAMDLICFVISDGEWEIEVNEQLDGWEELIQGLERIPGFPVRDEWFIKVAQPPFATNFTVLYERQ